MTTVSSSTSAQDIYSSLNKTSTTSTSTVEEQQSRFLKLLTTQLKNQDPLNPMDNAQTTSQLAQISTVDGIERLNATLKSMMGNMQSSEALQAANLVGHAVLVPGSGMVVTESIGMGGVQLDAVADKVSVTISDKNGLEIKHMELGALEAGVHDFVWDGKNDAGTAVVDGSYTMKVTAYKGDVKVGATALELGTVTGVVTSGSEVQVDVNKFGDSAQLGRVSMGDIKLIL
ncbi:flagellar hook assembly protein FlgD [Uliginosibacterium aquaticum]|uniref:Basal-body rod modification protein FlgD n=1 Tax=Uliginosibacterium aquaticum TaxID=2731212 RepID=A0ABX2IGX9_9RHOO|nr:flagellar hook assembly protein FlgD [Uliginosibacterium aquaticum]NSL55537.1 flagellar hook assembly protein FlgD [Uliginosibacterium aquaticum]